MGKIKRTALAAMLTGCAAEVGGAWYMFNRTMTRAKKEDVERSMKMSGTDWSKYADIFAERKAFQLSCEHSDMYVESFDGLKLHATYFPRGDEKKLVICFHGYTSEGMSDYIGLSDYYLKRDFSMLLVDLRAHGQSEGKYIGFGCLDRKDALVWINKMIEKCGEDVKILLHGTSMGAATALMTSGLDLPSQVKGVISDCGFTSPKEVFSHVLKNWYHVPPFPMMQISNIYNKKFAGYGIDECNSAREVAKSKIPFLLIHGSNDTFVPVDMCSVIEKNCATPVTKLIVEGAAHAESYYKDMEAYENALTKFIGEVL